MIALPLAFSWITALLVAPLDGRKQWVDWIAAAGLLGNLAATSWLAYRVFTQGPQVMVAGGWAPGVGIRLQADALGVVFVALANLLLLVALIYEDLGQVEERAFPALILFLSAGLTGLFLTSDAFNFYVFFEVSMAASFVLATYGQKQREIRDALIFSVVNLLGSFFFLGAVGALYHVTGTLDMFGIALFSTTVEPTTLMLIATLAFVAFGIKLGLFPFHFWLPAVYRGVQPVVAAILSGVLANIGSYGLLRFGPGLLSPVVNFSSNFLILLGSASVLYGALLAISRPTSREVLAYSSISQAGYILISLSVGGPVGFTTAVLFAVINALNKTLLFLSTGLRGRMVSAAYAIGALSVAGVPPAVGFIGKISLLRTAMAEDSLALVVLVFAGGGLSFVYMFLAYQRSYWKESPLENDNPARCLLVMGLAGLVLALGLWPEPLLWVSREAASVLVNLP